MRKGVRVQESLDMVHPTDARFGMVGGESLVDSDHIAEAATRDALHIMNVRNESVRANRLRLRRVITIVVALLVLCFLAWRVLVLY